MIEKNTDQDFFEFTLHSSDNVSIDLVPFQQDANLDILATLYDSGGNVIATENPIPKVSASFDMTLASGVYYLSVEGGGRGVRYSDYGSLGYYTVDINLESTAIDGDFNDDGLWNETDIDLLVADIVGGGTPALFDLNADGSVDNGDRDAWLVEAGAINLASGNPYPMGDANLDGFVDGQDFIRWNDNKFTNVAAWSAADFNADGAVDGSDFIIWNDNSFTNTAFYDESDENRPFWPLAHEQHASTAHEHDHAHQHDHAHEVEHRSLVTPLVVKAEATDSRAK